MNTVKQYIKDAIAGLDNQLDTSDSSALTDLLINPAAAMLDPIIAQINHIQDNLGINDPLNIADEELEAIAANFLITRVRGTKSTGYVELLYTTPQGLFIPADTQFFTGTGLVYVTTKDIYVDQGTMESNLWNYPYYSTGPISVESQDTGESTLIDPNTITSTSLTPAPARVTNPAAFAGGTDTETNLELAARLIVDVVSNSLASADSTAASLKKVFPTLQNLEVTGMGDEEMLRDLISSGVSSYDEIVRINYYGKVSGLNDPPYPQSVAYTSVFYDDPTTSGIVNDLPNPELFTQEFTTDQYGGIYTLNDVYKTTVGTTIILRDDFESSTFNSQWRLGDARSGATTINSPNEITLATHNNQRCVQLGETVEQTAVSSEIRISGLRLMGMINALRYASQYGAASSSDIPLLEAETEGFTNYDEVTTAVNTNLAIPMEASGPTRLKLYYAKLVKSFLDLYVTPATNHYPILSAPLDFHAGITVTGKFETNDTSESGRLSYVTVLRDGASKDPSNGYGFAWAKGDGTTFNVYLVDNSPLANDLFITDNFIVQANGENTWKAAAKVVLTPNTQYSFTLTIDPYYAMSLHITQVGGSTVLENLHIGGVTVSGLSEPAAGVDGSHFGISVLGTQNSLWWYDDIEVKKDVGIHSAVLFKYKTPTSIIPNNTQVTLDYYGYGNDGEGHNGLTLFLYEKQLGIWNWVEIGSNTAGSSTNRGATRITTDFVMGSSFRNDNDEVQALATTTYANTAVTSVSTYFTELHTATSSGVHTGGCADIYINDPSKILLAERIVTAGSTVALTTDNGFYSPLHSIISVQESLLNQELIENIDWALASGSLTSAFSVNESPYLSISDDFVNHDLRVVYRYYHSGEDVQTLLNSKQYRYSGTSNLAKIMPPVIVSVNNLGFRGKISEQAVRNAIKTYINTLSGDSLLLTDVLNVVYATGVSWIDVANIDITITAYNYRRENADPVTLTSEYTKAGISAFFCDDTSLVGVTKT